MIEKGDEKLLIETKQLEKSVRIENRWLDKIEPHLELILSLCSGVLIFIGWLTGKYGMETLSVITYISAYLIGGYYKAREGIEDTISKKELNVELLMILAAIGSAIIGYWTEGAILIFIFALSGALETYATNKSKKEISALMDLQPEEALRIKDGKEEKISVSELMVGDILLIKPGERIPADGKIIEGETSIDEAAITGESIPVDKSQHDEIYAGTVNLGGTVLAEMTKPNDESLFQKIIYLVECAQSEKSPTQQFIERFEGIYVKIVLIATLLMMVLPHYLLGWSWTETFYRAMVLLVVASPCALVASIMPATLSAIANGARQGVLFKGGVHLENLAKVKAIALDKTGTLTKGKPEVVDVLVRDDLTEEQLLRYVGSIEKYSNHPLASAIVDYAAKRVEEWIKPQKMKEFAGFGAQAELEGELWKVGKEKFVGEADAREFRAEITTTFAEQGKTIVYARDEKGIAGLLTLKDRVRDESITAVQSLKKEGIETVMLTGDGRKTAAAIAAEVEVNSYVAECLPETKVTELKRLKEQYGNVAMVGDGINDAPALATATVGIAIGEGTDVALETADVVLMKSDLPRIAEAVKLSKRMNRVIKQNLIFSIGVILVLIFSNFMQSLALPIGVIGHEGSTILVILNGLRLLR